MNSHNSTNDSAYEIVIRPKDFSTQDEQSRREYLQQYAPVALLEQVINYWKTNLQEFVPQPEFVQKSDYTEHAHWMLALKELSPNDYQALLDQWRVAHKRRRNLWKAMKQAGLIV
ncbi:MAG: hypothetical protein F6J86_33075 [Symploca sp. SIO1B1]|nr:hypothetical protein [Symploca sp. SIO1B1]